MRWFFNLLWFFYWKIWLKRFLASHGIEEFKRRLLATGYSITVYEIVDDRLITEYVRGESKWTFSEYAKKQSADEIMSLQNRKGEHAEPAVARKLDRSDL